MATPKQPKSSKSTAAVVADVTTEAPRDPRWDQARHISDQLRLCGRVFLRGQVKLGMILSALKKEAGISQGKRPATLPDSGKVLPWADLVKQETGYSRQSCDEFIRLYEATISKLKKSKKLELPAPAKKDALALFRTENPLSLSEAQWEQVDEIIGTLTTGETQSSLMQELGIVPKPPKMPKPEKQDGKEEGGEEPTADQLAFHFFDGVASSLVNARTSPDYKMLLAALPLQSDPEHPLSLATLEAEIRATLADIEEAKQSLAKPATGRVIKPAA